MSTSRGLALVSEADPSWGEEGLGTYPHTSYAQGGMLPDQSELLIADDIMGGFFLPGFQCHQRLDTVNHSAILCDPQVVDIEGSNAQISSERMCGIATDHLLSVYNCIP